ncbi:hypothetical protein M0805_001468 [Coniferiporia weirii]|nr:hypothetical protein M0805_001468 [Coniferiporia weirii]
MDLSHIFADASDLVIVKYTSVATATLCVYEYLLTLDSEMRLVWLSRFTAVKVLFIANRYLPFLITFSNALGTYTRFTCPFTSADSLVVLVYLLSLALKFCGPAFLAIGLVSVTGFALAEVVLAVRVYVVWKARKSILVLLSCLICVRAPLALSRCSTNNANLYYLSVQAVSIAAFAVTYFTLSSAKGK